MIKDPTIMVPMASPNHQLKYEANKALTSIIAKPTNDILPIKALIIGAIIQPYKIKQVRSSNLSIFNENFFTLINKYHPVNAASVEPMDIHSAGKKETPLSMFARSEPSNTAGHSCHPLNNKAVSAMPADGQTKATWLDDIYSIVFAAKK